MRLIGSMCCGGGGDEWPSIYSAVQSCVSSLHSETDIATAKSSGSPCGTKREDLSLAKSPPGSGSIEIFRYSMALNEHCERVGEIMRCEEECLRAYPPSFRAEVHIQGFSFSGTASSKKMARHHACRQACVEMNIKP